MGPCISQHLQRGPWETAVLGAHQVGPAPGLRSGTRGHGQAPSSSKPQFPGLHHQKNSSTYLMQLCEHKLGLHMQKHLAQY